MVRRHKIRLHRCTNRLDIYQEVRSQYANCRNERVFLRHTEFDIPSYYFCVLQHNDLLVADVLPSTSWDVIFSYEIIRHTNQAGWEIVPDLHLVQSFFSIERDHQLIQEIASYSPDDLYDQYDCILRPKSDERIRNWMLVS